MNSVVCLDDSSIHINSKKQAKVFGYVFYFVLYLWIEMVSMILVINNE